MNDKVIRLKGETVNRRPRTTQVRFSSETGRWTASRKVDGAWHWLGEFASSTAAYEATHSAARLATCIDQRQQSISRVS